VTQHGGKASTVDRLVRDLSAGLYELHPPLSVEWQAQKPLLGLVEIAGDGSSNVTS
jgi:hypothetical protein